MPTDDTTQDAGESPMDGSTGPAAPSSDTEGTTAAEQIASYKKRQAGAEAARQAAERKYTEAEKELAAFRAQSQTDAQKDLSELARLQEQLKAAEQRASEAEAKAAARILDAKYPNARAELPEVTDEVRLAKFEAMLKDDEPAESTGPKPQGANPKRDAGPATKAIEDMTVEELRKHLYTFDPSVMTASR